MERVLLKGLEEMAREIGEVVREYIEYLRGQRRAFRWFEDGEGKRWWVSIWE